MLKRYNPAHSCCHLLSEPSRIKKQEGENIVCKLSREKAINKSKNK